MRCVGRSSWGKIARIHCLFSTKAVKWPKVYRPLPVTIGIVFLGSSVERVGCLSFRIWKEQFSLHLKVHSFSIMQSETCHKVYVSSMWKWSCQGQTDVPCPQHPWPAHFPLLYARESGLSCSLFKRERQLHSKAYLHKLPKHPFLPVFKQGQYCN